MGKRKRSNMTLAECDAAVKEFANIIIRHGETSGADMFRTDQLNLPHGQKNVQFLVTGDFGVADKLFEAFRIYRGIKLPREE